VSSTVAKASRYRAAALWESWARRCKSAIPRRSRRQARGPLRSPSLRRARYEILDKFVRVSLLIIRGVPEAYSTVWSRLSYLMFCGRRCGGCTGWSRRGLSVSTSRHVEICVVQKITFAKTIQSVAIR
jgi:hypothetical protein